MLKTFFVAIWLIVLWSPKARSEPPLRATRTEPPASFNLLDEINREVPALRHPRGSRWPMIFWQAGSFEPQSPEVYRQMLSRGFTQHIRLDESMISTAQALQRAGSPVIMMQGEGGTYPYSTAGDPKEWAHQFDVGYAPKNRVHACPAVTKGWAANANRIRTTLQHFKDAGVTVDAVWMDWEVEPAVGEGNYEQAIHCARCRATLPREVLSTELAFEDYCSRKYVELVGTYLAAPVAEIFPGCSTTNWEAIVSSPEHPILGWEQQTLVPLIPPVFTASNPVAYGMTLFFDQWKDSFKLDREHVDQLYAHLLLRQISCDTANRKIWAPQMESIPWVARWCAADVNPKESRPIMSRERYREVLRHLWLRGISGMQIFNSIVPGYEQMTLYEIKDAVAVYDEMLEYRDFLEKGEPMNLAVPKLQDDGVLWSGLLMRDTALIRTFKQGSGTGSVMVEPWAGSPVRLKVTSAGETYRLVLKEGRVMSEKLSPPR
jgi:hypothetical protein